MAIVRVNAASDSTLFAAGNTKDCWRIVVGQAARLVPRSAPITILLHGYRYSWKSPSRAWRCDPQQTLYHVSQRSEFAEDPALPTSAPLAGAWPGALGFSHGDPTSGLCIPFGWDARKAGLSGFAKIHRSAADVASGLIRLIEHIGNVAPGHPVDIFAHSLGARLILQALTVRPDLPIGRVLLLAPAERRSTALTALERLDSVGSEAQFLHVLARANDIFDGLYELIAPPSGAYRDLPLGAAGLGSPPANWLDFQIDSSDARIWLHGLGLRPAPTVSRVSHWVVYTDPAIMTLYRRMLHNRQDWSIDAMMRSGVPTGIDPRWSRLRPAMPNYRPREKDRQGGTTALPA